MDKPTRRQDTKDLNTTQQNETQVEVRRKFNTSGVQISHSLFAFNITPYIILIQFSWKSASFCVILLTEDHHIQCKGIHPEISSFSDPLLLSPT